MIKNVRVSSIYQLNKALVAAFHGKFHQATVSLLVLAGI